MQKEKLLEYYKKTTYRIFTKLDCTFLPKCIQQEVDEFLANQFAYSFALENLCLSLDSCDNDENAEIKIFLPKNPYANFYKDLFNFGIISPPRISNHSELAKEDFGEEFDTIYKIIMDNKTKVFDRTEYHLSMIPFEKFLNDQGQSTTNGELKPIMDNGIKAVLSKAEKSLGFHLLSEAVGVVTRSAKAIWSGIKSVGNFFYSIGSSVFGWFSDYIINPVSNVVNTAAAAVSTLTKKVAHKIKDGITMVATKIAESDAFKVCLL